jgi:hypothetical protein
VIHQHRREERGGHLGHVVVTRSWSMKCTVEPSEVVHAGRTLEDIDPPGAEREGLVRRQKANRATRQVGDRGRDRRGSNLRSQGIQGEQETWGNPTRSR